MGRPFVSIRYHFVWGTWQRHPLVPVHAEARVHACVRAKCVELDVIPLTVGGVEDHMHLFVGAPASLAPSTIVGQVKGASSHLINHEILPGGSFRWQGGYGVFTVSRELEAVVGDYVLRQRLHHELGTVWPDLETIDREP